VTVEDLLAWESQHGQIPDGAVVVMNSGWGRNWNDTLKYFGLTQDEYDNFGQPGSSVLMHHPGFSEEAARLIASERAVT